MQITGMLTGAKLLGHVGFPTTEVLGPDATESEIQNLIDRHKLVFIKPVFRGGVGKKGKAGLIGKASDLKTALAQKERLYFAEHRHGNATAKANGVTFEAGVPAEHEVYFSITDDSRFRAPTMTLTHRGGVDIEELPILWHSPDPRMVLIPAELRVSRSLRKTLRRRPFRLSVDTAFETRTGVSGETGAGRR